MAFCSDFNLRISILIYISSHITTTDRIGGALSQIQMATSLARLSRTQFGLRAPIESFALPVSTHSRFYRNTVSAPLGYPKQVLRSSARVVGDAVWCVICSISNSLEKTDRRTQEGGGILLRLAVPKCIARMEYREIVDVLDVTPAKGEPQVEPVRSEVQRIQRLRLALRYWRDTLRPRKGLEPGEVTARVLDDEFLLWRVVEQRSARVRRINGEPEASA